jgi:aconitase A
MVGRKEGSYTIKYPEGNEMFIYDAAVEYQAQNIRLDTDIDVAYFENGGILPYVLRKMLSE